MNHYLVFSPEMHEVIPILDYGEGPLEYFSCSCTVFAKTKREAEILAVKHPEMEPWVSMQRSDGHSPFTGLKVVNALCSHGKCACDKCRDWCQQCYEEMTTENA